ncbi:pimeloyl-ACP methyl ester carboxylesterase [Rhizobium etli]|uniref:Pimeloyl-ACP methyl ester carboxylesterase n=1 Tax=Rhizobium etli TaxID=29449 RepID=A0A7W6YAW5_RHIET|nr:pimeloyl-ACP methyl ester carboxylesterase [Rhizobium etli]MBB4539226.1 pimeloyl-ACP methyl ester carboxylesterase [Rhizobium etli]
MGSGYITTKDGTQIFCKDWGGKGSSPSCSTTAGRLVSDDWDAQMLFFLAYGYRVVAHDRRGHGRSTQVDTGNDMDH